MTRAAYIPTAEDIAREAAMLPLIDAAIKSGARVRWRVGAHAHEGRAVVIVPAREAVQVPDEYAHAGASVRAWSRGVAPLARVIVVSPWGRSVRLYAPTVRSVAVCDVVKRRVVA